MAPVLPPDIILLICEELGNQRDFGTLFNAALASKHFTASALLWIYRGHTKTSIEGAESNEDEISKTGALNPTLKRAKQWKSIILSSLGKTAYPYCLYLLSLDLSDLQNLFGEPDIRNSLYGDIFADSMEILLQSPDRILTRHNSRPSLETIVHSVGESISKYAGEFTDRTGGTAALEDLRGEIERNDLSKWVRQFPRLKFLTLWSGLVLDTSVADVIKTSCPHFDSLCLYYCKGSMCDANLSQFFSGLRENTLQFLQVLSQHAIGPATFLSLNNHYASLKQLIIGNLQPFTVKSLPLLKRCTAIESLDLEESPSVTNLELADKEILLDVIAWLVSCKQLKHISLKKFPNGPRILTAVCLDEMIHLESLLLEQYPLLGNQDFHRALACQTSLKSLDLKGDPEDSFRDDIDVLVASICKLKNLKYLKILEISDDFRTSEIQLIAIHLSQLEDLTTSGEDIDDEIFSALTTLPNLRSLSFQALTSFTITGLLGYIASLQPTNAGMQLSVMCAAAGSALSERQIRRVREALERKVGGKFEFVMHREEDVSMSGSDSD